MGGLMIPLLEDGVHGIIVVHRKRVGRAVKVSVGRGWREQPF